MLNEPVISAIVSVSFLKRDGLLKSLQAASIASANCLSLRVIQIERFTWPSKCDKVGEKGYGRACK